MLLSRREYRDRAVGLVGAYAVLIAGIAFSGALDPAPEKHAMKPTEAALDRAKTKKAHDCSYALDCRSDTFC